LTVDLFLSNGFHLLEQLAAFLELEPEALQQRLPSSNADLAALHPGAFDPQTVEQFYEEMVGDAHLLELADWHLGSATYIADTLRLQAHFARGEVLDFGGGHRHPRFGGRGPAGGGAGVVCGPESPQPGLREPASSATGVSRADQLPQGSHGSGPAGPV
jgi:hypothetical protein